MKSDAEITKLIQQKQYDGVRYACAERLRHNKLDIQAWVSLGQAMIGLSRTHMANICFDRAALLDPFGTWLQHRPRLDSDQRRDKQVERLLDVPRQTVTACILTRNNQETIADCLQHLRYAVDEVIVVDTGSDDDTVAIVESLGVQVHRFTWIDDFSEARNFAHALATSDWVIAVDSDEILDQRDAEHIRICAGLYEEIPAPVVIHPLQVNRAIGFATDVTPVARMFRRDGVMRWIRRIHEYPSTAEAEQLVYGPVVRIRLEHRGYDAQQTEVHEKYARNIQLLQRDLEDDDADPRTLYFLGREHLLLGDEEPAHDYLQRAKDHAIARKHPVLTDVDKLLASILHHQG